MEVSQYHLDKILHHPRMVESSLRRVGLYPMILVKQPVPRLLPHIDDELLEAEALVVNDRGGGVLQGLGVALIPGDLGLPVISIDLQITQCKKLSVHV